MASGHVNRANRPNTWLHRPGCDVKKVLANSEPSTHANSEPSTHGTKRTCRGEFAHVRLEGRTGPRVSDDAASAFGPKADIGRTGFRTERAPP
jgi:hypothetical protein